MRSSNKFNQGRLRRGGMDLFLFVSSQPLANLSVQAARTRAKSTQISTTTRNGRTVLCVPPLAFGRLLDNEPNPHHGAQQERVWYQQAIRMVPLSCFAVWAWGYSAHAYRTSGRIGPSNWGRQKGRAKTHLGSPAVHSLHTHSFSQR